MKKFSIFLILCLIGVSAACDEFYNTTNLNQSLTQSILNENNEKVLRILKNGANPNYKDSGFPVIFYSMAGKSIKCNSEILSALLEHNADPNIKGIGAYPIHIAVSTGDIQCVDLLLKYGANINIQNNITGATVLHEALAHENTSILIYLIENGANIFLKDSKGRTALQAAEEMSHNAAVMAINKSNGVKTDEGGSTELRQ